MVERSRELYDGTAEEPGVLGDVDTPLTADPELLRVVEKAPAVAKAALAYGKGLEQVEDSVDDARWRGGPRAPHVRDEATRTAYQTMYAARLELVALAPSAFAVAAEQRDRARPELARLQAAHTHMLASWQALVDLWEGRTDPYPDALHPEGN